jgi:hypothetical protein
MNALKEIFNYHSYVPNVKIFDTLTLVAMISSEMLS